jgi:hypothetical protein
MPLHPLIVLDVSKNWLTTTILTLVEEIAMPFDLTFMRKFGVPFKNISYSNILNHVYFFQPSHAQKGSIEKIPKLMFMRINTKSPKFSQFLNYHTQRVVAGYQKLAF